MEVVLEDGRFARIRRPVRGDWVAAFSAANGDIHMAMAIFTASITTIDGEPMTIKDWLDADVELTQPIAEVISRMSALSNSNPNKGGVA
jgi:hypothetical protein